jgi:choline dehydrogenase-like flavoprotein
MAGSTSQGIVDSDCKIFGIDQGYICDGSVIPGTRYANTGLSTAALSLRLQQHLRAAA